MAQMDVKPISSQDISAILSGNPDSIITPAESEAPVSKEEKKEEPSQDQFKAPLADDFKWSDLEKLVDEDGKEDEEDDKEPADDKSENKPQGDSKEKPEDEEKKKVGRKPTDVVALVNQMIADKEIKGFEDADEVKTIEEARELLKANLVASKDLTEEEVWEKKLSSYSPQIQAILEYAEQGGTDLYPLISAIAEVEKTGEFSTEDEKGQENVMREYLKLQGWEEEDIKEEIETAKDLDKLKTKSDKFLPKLNQMKEERVQMIMEQQVERNRQAQEARNNYLKTIKTALDKEKIGDIKLQKSDKSLLWNSVTDVSYKSLSGAPTNKFFKTLEDLQIGETANYEHFLEIVHLAVDRENFKKKLREEVSSEVSAQTARRLKTEEKKIANSTENLAGKDDRKADKIQRAMFKNPYG